MVRYFTDLLRLLVIMAVTCIMVPAFAASSASLSYEGTQLRVDTREGQLQFEVSAGKQTRLQLQKLLFNYQAAIEWTITRRSEQSIELVGRFAPSVDFYRTVEDNEERRATLA